MNYRIERKLQFDVFGIEAQNSIERCEPAELWRKAHENGDYEKLFGAAGKLPEYVPDNLCKVHGIENYCKTGREEKPYMLCAFVSDSSNTLGYKVVHVPEQTYVILQSEPFKWDEDFSNTLKNLKEEFNTKWLPESEYEKVDAAQFEIYGGDEKYGYIELWYPIRKVK